MGFVRVSAEPNYFGEVELRTPVVDGRLRDVEDRIGRRRSECVSTTESRVVERGMLDFRLVCEAGLRV